MAIFRLIAGLVAMAAVLCFAMYIGTHDVIWRDRGVLIVKWSVIAALVFFAVLFVERLVESFG